MPGWRSQVISLDADSVIKVHDLRTNRCLQTIAGHDWPAAADAKPAALVYDARRRCDALRLSHVPKACTVFSQLLEVMQPLRRVQEFRMSARHAAGCSQWHAGTVDHMAIQHHGSTACCSPVGG
jgi:hypothetical protein